MNNKWRQHLNMIKFIKLDTTVGLLLNQILSDFLYSEYEHGSN